MFWTTADAVVLIRRKKLATSSPTAGMSSMRSKKKTLRSLRFALKRRNADKVREVLRLRPSLRTPDGGQMLWDIVTDDPKIASMLVQAGVDLAERNPIDNSTPLLYASSRSANEEYENLALLMLERGANVNSRTMRTGDTALHLAVRNESVPLVTALVDNGLSVDIANSRDETAICLAAKAMRAREMMRLMVEQRPVGRRNRRLLDAIEFLICCESNEAAAIGEVLELGVDVNERSGCGLTPLALAVARGKTNLIEMLAKFGADTNQMMTETRLPMIRASYMEQDLFVNLVREQDAANVNAYNEYGRTRLHELCACSKFLPSRNLQLLLHLGADVNALDHRGNTPFAQLVDDDSSSRQLYVKHLAMQFWKGAIVSDVDMTILRNNLDVGRFYEECLDELQRMRDTVVYSSEDERSFSVFDFFVRGRQTVSRLARRRQFLDGYQRTRELFTIYRQDLEIAFNLAKIRRDTLLLGEFVVNSMTNRVLPEGLPRRALEMITLYVCYETLGEAQRKYYFKMWARTDVREVVDDGLMVVN